MHKNYVNTSTPQPNSLIANEVLETTTAVTKLSDGILKNRQFYFEGQMFN